MAYRARGKVWRRAALAGPSRDLNDPIDRWLTVLRSRSRPVPSLFGEWSQVRAGRSSGRSALAVGIMPSAASVRSGPARRTRAAFQGRAPGELPPILSEQPNRILKPEQSFPLSGCCGAQRRQSRTQAPVATHWLDSLNPTPRSGGHWYELAELLGWCHPAMRLARTLFVDGGDGVELTVGRVRNRGCASGAAAVGCVGPCSCHPGRVACL